MDISAFLFHKLIELKIPIIELLRILTELMLYCTFLLNQIKGLQCLWSARENILWQETHYIYLPDALEIYIFFPTFFFRRFIWEVNLERILEIAFTGLKSVANFKWFDSFIRNQGPFDRVSLQACDKIKLGAFNVTTYRIKLLKGIWLSCLGCLICF